MLDLLLHLLPGRLDLLLYSPCHMVAAPTTASSGRAPAPRSDEPTQPRRVALTDAQERASLAAIRCLGTGGYAVTATASRPNAPGLWSRHCAARRLLADPTEDLQAFLCGLERILASRPHDLLIAGTDAALFAVSHARERLAKVVCLALAPHEVVQRCLSKRALLDGAAKVGLAGPETLLCDSAAEALRAARRLGFPLLVKPDEVIRLHEVPVVTARRPRRAVAVLHRAWLPDPGCLGTRLAACRRGSRVPAGDTAVGRFSACRASTGCSCW